MKHYDLSINGGPVLARVEAPDFAGAATQFGIDASVFTETSPGSYEGGRFVVQEIDAEPFFAAIADLEALVALLDRVDPETGESHASRSPAMARIAGQAKQAAQRGRRGRG
jgi:hypothetical protein